MKKKVIITFGSIIGAIALILILMFTGVIPNIFVDRSDLTCSRVYLKTEESECQNIVVIKFDNVGVVKGGTKQDKLIYNNEELALKSYDQLQKSIINPNNVEAKIEGKIITTNSILEISLDQKKMKKNKIKKVYEEFGYECK